MNSVLIVDDDRRILDFLSRILSREGYETRVAADGEVALREIAIVEVKNER